MCPTCCPLTVSSTVWIQFTRGGSGKVCVLAGTKAGDGSGTAIPMMVGRGRYGGGHRSEEKG